MSAGYDAHWRDPLAGLQMRTSTYHRLAQQLAGAAQQLCGGRVVFLLEGGYDLKALGASVADSFRGLLGEPSADSFNPDLLREEPAHKACRLAPVLVPQGMPPCPRARPHEGRTSQRWQLHGCVVPNAFEMLGCTQ